MPHPVRVSLPPHPCPPGPRSTASTILRGAASTVLLIVLLAGLPALLWWGTGIVARPGIAALGSLLTTQDSGQVFLLALAVAAWTGWALFAVAVIVEAATQVRGRTAPAVRWLIGQRLAAGLISAIVMALPTTTALASAAPAQAVAATASSQPGGVPEASAAKVSSPGGAPASDQHTVTYLVRNLRPAESLWSIAHHHLGDGNRWEEIAHLNEGRTMADGTTFRSDAPIQPGWTLLLPRDAAPAAADPSPHTHTPDREPVPDTATYTVRSGDTLSDIAEQRLGDPTAYTRIFQLNEGEPQPGGGRFTDPDIIVPGQRLTLPTPPETQPGGADNTTPPGTGPHHTVESPPTPARPAPPSQAPAPPAPASPPRPAPSPTSSPQAAPSHAPAAAPVRMPSPTVTPGRTGDADSSIQDIAQAAGITALLAAGLLGSLGTKRLLQQRRRRAGQTIAIDPDPTRLEAVLHAAAEPAGAARLDLALRTMAHHARNQHADLPSVRGAQLTDHTLHLLVDAPATPVLEPFTRSERPGQWTLDPTAPLLDADAAGTVPAPYPALVTLGSTAEGHLLLANLLQHRILLLDGEPDEILAVARALTLEAASSAWSDHAEIMTVGLGARLAALLPQGRIRPMAHLPAVTADLGALLLEVHQQAHGPNPLPWILICATEVEPDHIRQLADALSAACALPVAAVLPSSEAARTAFPAAGILSAAAAVEVELPSLAAEPFTLQRLEDEQYRELLHALQVTEQPAQPATGAWQMASDHDVPATTPLPDTTTVLPSEVRSASHAGPSDPGDPFPALLASVRAPATSGEPALARKEHSADQSEEPTEPAHAADPASTAATDQVQAAGQEAVGQPDPPEINVLGPLHVTGIAGSGHGSKLAALAALIHLRPGRSADALCAAMDPRSPWSTRTLQSRLSEIRARFGSAPDGSPYLPRPDGGYRFAPAVRSDWARFQSLAGQGLAAGPEHGIAALEDALALVRGRPFTELDAAWTTPIEQEMISRIVDVAHTLATWHAGADARNLDAARRAVLRGLDVDETAEVLYRDWMHIEHTAGNHAGLRKVITRIHQIARAYDIDLEPLTEQTINQLLGERTSRDCCPPRTSTVRYAGRRERRSLE